MRFGVWARGPVTWALLLAFDVHMLVSAVLSERAALSGIEVPAWFARIASRGSRMGRG
jgi:hypothetical protein